jgi:arylsulfatase A
MKRNKLTSVALSLVILTSVSMASPTVDDSPKRATSPNIIVILTDDQGYGDLSCYGAKDLHTPNIDRMASEGLRLTSFYAAPVCSPSRAMLMTGRYAQRVGITIFLNNPTKGLAPEEITLAEILREQGYATGLIGKWHLGLPDEMNPIAQGFDYWAGIPLSHIRHGETEHDVYYTRQWRTMERDKPTKIEYHYKDTELTRRCTDESIAFMRRHRDKPFFLYLAHPMTHREVVASKAFQGRSKRGNFGDAVEELDWSVMKVLDELKTLKLDKKTLVIYASDNGGKGTRGRNAEVHPEQPLGSNLPLRGFKARTWEGGPRVPCVIRWPGKIPAGRVSDEIVSIMDIMTTCVYVGDGKLPTDRKIDGINIWPLLSGESKQSGRKVFFYHNLRGSVCGVRKGKWKLHAEIRSDEAKPWQLFDLDADISETTDLAAKHPEVVKELHQLLQKNREDVGDSITHTKGRNTRPLGEFGPGKGILKE